MLVLVAEVAEVGDAVVAVFATLATDAADDEAAARRLSAVSLLSRTVTWSLLARDSV